MLQTSRYVEKSRNIEKTILTEILQCTAVLYSDWSLQMGQTGTKMTQGTLTMSPIELSWTAKKTIRLFCTIVIHSVLLCYTVIGHLR